MNLHKMTVFSLTLFLALALIGGCASKNSKTSTKQSTDQTNEFTSDINAPNWYFNPPRKEGSLFATASATSSRFTTAINKAKLSATRNLAASIQSTLEGQRERYIEEIGNTANDEGNAVREQYQDLMRQMVAQELRGVRLVEKGIVQNDSGYRAFVLMELTMDDFKENLSNKEELKTRFNAEQFEQDMEENLKNMRQRQSS